MKTVISTIALKFLEKGGNSSIKLEPLVSKDAPEWLFEQQSFKEAREKGLVRATEDVKDSAQKLDQELVKLATKLEVVFTAEMSNATLGKLVEQAKVEQASLIEQVKEKGGEATANMKISTLKAKLEA